MIALENRRSMPSLIQDLTFARVEEPFTLETAPRVRDLLSPLLDAAGHVVLDLRSPQLDSVGLGALLSIQRKLELQGRSLFVVTADPEFRALVDAAGVSEALTVFSEVEQAIREAHERDRHAFAA